MTPEAKYRNVNGLRIDRPEDEVEKKSWWLRPRGWMVISIPVLLGVSAFKFLTFDNSAPEVEIFRAVSQGSTENGIILQGSGYIVPHHKIDVNSKVTGRVRSINVEAGDKVRAGQLLVQLEDDEFKAQEEAARGEVENAQAQLDLLENGSRPEEVQQASANLDEARTGTENARVTLERAKLLAEQGIVSRQQLDDAQAKYDAAREHMQSLQQLYEVARKGARREELDRARGALATARGRLALAQSQVEATSIRAPITGTILERTAEKGELVTAQFASALDTRGPRGSVVSLADLSDLRVELDISQNDFARLGPKQRAVITTDAYPDRHYGGVIDKIAPEANRQKATVQVELKILNPDAYLRPEMNASVSFLAEEHDSGRQISPAAIVPITAVRDRDGKKVVFIAFEGHAVQHTVKILAQRSDGYLAEGLAGGEELIVNGPSDLKEGDRIRVRQ